MPTESTLVATLFLSARCFGALLFLPASEPISFMSKLGLSLIISSLFIETTSSTAFSWSSVGALALLFEVLTGVILTLPVTAAIDGIAALGEHFDAVRGQTAGNLHDPLTMNLASLSSSLLRNGFVAALCANGGLIAAVELLHNLAVVIPPGSPTALFAPDALHHFLGTYCAVFALFLLPALGCLTIEVLGAFVAKSARGAAQTELLYFAKMCLGSLLLLQAVYNLDAFGVWR
jgi:flagellar biosynthesis protein FliR